MTSPLEIARATARRLPVLGSVLRDRDRLRRQERRLQKESERLAGEVEALRAEVGRIQDLPLAEAFHALYYDSLVWQQTRWLGTWVRKCPLDLWIYQELLFEQRPDLIVETGTFDGGSALYFASLFDLIGNGRIVSLDVREYGERPSHPRIEFVLGDSASPDMLESIRGRVGEGEKVMVVLDSDHSRDHVLAELRAYAPLVTPGSYLVVEDSNVNGNPVRPDFGPGPAEAIAAFLAEHPEFEVDKDREKFFVSFNPGGWLRRRED